MGKRYLRYTKPKKFHETFLKGQHITYMKNKLFIVILLLSILFRFYKLGTIPSSLDWDEVSNAYNAYSILKTGNDEYGNFLPLANRSFNDYKPPLYMYLNVPSIAVFGLTPFAARLPSALLGTISVIFIYFLTKRLFQKENLALIVMSLAAISPWQIQFSRVGFEANIGLFTTIASFTLLLYSLPVSKEKFSFIKSLFLLASSILFGLSFYSYHSERIFIPLLLFATAIIYKNELLKIPKIFLVFFVLIILLIILPFFLLTPLKAISQRLQETSQLSTIQNIDQSINFIKEDHYTFTSRLIHNRRFLIAINYARNYLSHFDVNYLFIKGDDNLRHHIENMGMLYLVELPFLLYGIYLFVKNRSKSTTFVLAWLLFSPVPAAPSNVAPHAIRSFTMIIALEIIIGYAILEAYKVYKFKKAYILVITLIFGLSALIYIHNYYVHYWRDNASWWQYGYLQTVAKTEALKNNFNRIIVDPSIEQAYAFWLFGTKYDPSAYQQIGSKNHFGNYYFSSQAPESSKDLFVSAGNFPSDFAIVDSINYPDGKKDISIGHPK